MDDQRFDGITKALAGGTGRREVLKRLAGGVLAGGFALTGVARAGAAPACRKAGHPCEGNQTCCPGLACIEALGPGQAARCGTPPPPPVCENPAFCNGFHPCCDGTVCTGAGQCVATPACLGTSCNAFHPCCSNTSCTSNDHHEGQCVLA